MSESQSQSQSQSQTQSQLSQSELDEIISPRYIEKSLGPGTLSTRLQTVASILPRIDQEDDDRIGQLDPLVDQLGKHWLLKQKNPQIKLLLSCIYSDVLRIYAPEQPYSDDDTLTKMFELMILSLDGVQNPNDADYDFHFRVLESLSTVQSYIVMNDLENEMLLMLLTKQLFKITKESTVKLSLNHVTDILCGVINDIQVIPETFLQFILERLIEPIRSQYPTEYDLATTVIRRCADDLKLAIDEYIANTIATVDDLCETAAPDDDGDYEQAYDEDDDIKMNGGQPAHIKRRRNRKKAKQMVEKRKIYRSKLSIVTELASVSVDFIENSLLSLEECLQNEHLEIRLLFVDMFASIFTQSSPSLSRQWTPLFRVFLKRYDDVAVEIREFMANITCLLFQTQHAFAKEIQEFCIQRIEDVHERIRREITKQVCMASIQCSSNSPTSIISVPLFNKLLTRTLDKKQSVRYTAMEYCAKLFGQHLCPYWRNNKALPSEMRALLPIPKKMISILGAIDFNTKLRLESIFDEEMIGNEAFTRTNKKPYEIQTQIEQRMNVLLGIIALLPDDSKKQFQKYFMREKYQLHRLIQKILKTYNELRMANSHQNNEIQSHDTHDRNVLALQRQYEISYSNFNQRFPMYKIPKSKASSSSLSSPKSKAGVKQKPSDLLKQCIEHPNGKMRHCLQSLCAPSTKLKSIYNGSHNLLSFVGSMSADKSMKKAEMTRLNEFARSLCVRLSNVLFSCDAIPVLLHKLVDIVEQSNGQPRALLNSGIFILNCLCDEIPTVFDDHPCLQALIKCFNFPKTSVGASVEVTRQLSFVSLRILAKSITAHSFDHEDNDDALQDFLQDLTEKARASASYQEAQLATECLVKSQGKYAQIIRTLCEETSKELDMTEQYLPTLLSTLAVIAKLSPNIFITRATHITEFILETLLPYDANDENDGIYQENNIAQQEEEEEEDAADQKKRGRKRAKMSKKKKNKMKKMEERASMTPIVLSSKQCGIQILVNYLLSIADLPKDQLGIQSPMKSSPSSKRSASRSPKRKSKNKNDKEIDIHSDDDDDGDIHMNDDNEEEEATHLEGADDEIQMMEEADPFSNDNHNTLQQPISPEIECDRILDALFALIRKYGQINPDEIEYEPLPRSKPPTRKYSRQQEKKRLRTKRHEITNEEVCLVNMAVDGILDVIRQPRYRRLLGLIRFYEVGFLIHHKNERIRTHTLQSFWNRLRDHKLPSHYSCILPLIATDPSKKLRDVYRPAVQKYFDRMRKENQIRTSSSMDLGPLQISKLPEYLLFYVVHLLAHHPDFDERLARKELKESDSSSYKHKKAKANAFVGWRGRRVTAKSSDSEYDTSPSRMIKKKKATQNEDETEVEMEEKEKEKTVNDKKEAEESEDIDIILDDDKKERRKPGSTQRETSCIDYFGTIFDFYFRALLRGSQSNQFPLIIKIMTKMDQSYDVFIPLSKGHRYLIRIAMQRLKKLYKNKSFQDFPGRVPLPKALFKLRDSHQSHGGHSSTSGGGYDSTEKVSSSSPRRVASKTSKHHSKRSGNLTSHRLLRADADQSLLATTASDSVITAASLVKSKKPKGIFSSELLKKKYGNLQLDQEEETEKKKVEENEDEEEREKGSDHPSDDDIMNDMGSMNVSGLDMSAIQRKLNETIIDRTEDGNNNNDDEDKEKANVKLISSGSGAEADDEVNIIETAASKQKKRTIGKKRKRGNGNGNGNGNVNVSTNKNDDDKNDDDNNDEEPPKKRLRRRGTRRK